MQKERRHNPYPFTWEIPVGILCGLLVVLIFGAHGARAMANLFAGAGLTMPAGTELFSSIGGLLSGDAGAGLHPRPVTVATPSALRLWLVIVELLVLALATVALGLGLQRWGPWRLRGMATKSEAIELLGERRLHKGRAIVRPDLYGHDSHTTEESS